MKGTKYILLFIGSAALLVTIYELFNGKSITESLIPMVCGASLVFGYFQLKKSED